jgi:hypothetical protein
VLDKLDEEEIAKMDADEIMARQMEELEREKKELRVRFNTAISGQNYLKRLWYKTILNFVVSQIYCRPDAVCGFFFMFS